jgi:hypothetical protein
MVIRSANRKPIDPFSFVPFEKNEGYEFEILCGVKISMNSSRDYIY